MKRPEEEKSSEPISIDEAKLETTPKKKKKAVQSLDAAGSSSSSPRAAAFRSDGTFCSFPMSRVWRLVRGECTASSSGAAAAEIRTTADAVFLINKASEMFLERITEDVHAIALKERKKYISYNLLSSNVTREKRYEFLSDFVPEKVRAEDALKARSLIEA